MKKSLKRVEINLISQLVLSLLVMIMGIVVMVFKSFGLVDINLYIAILFFIYAFLSTITYFVRRKEGDYELLILALINIINATFIYVFKKDDVPMILGISMTIYTILVVANRGYKIITLKREDNYIWIIKFMITFLIGFLGLLTTFNLFNEVTVQTMMYGYYFISLGLMLTIEDVIEMFITSEKIKKMMDKVLEEEPKRELESVKDEVVKKEKKEVKEDNKKISTPKKTETKKDVKPSSKKTNKLKKDTREEKSTQRNRMKASNLK